MPKPMLHQPSTDSDRTQTVNLNPVTQQPPQQAQPQQAQPQQGQPQQAQPQQGQPQQAPLQQAQPQQQPPQQQPWPDQQGRWAPQQNWAGQDGGTPWGDSDLPPTPEHGDTSWMRQGPEVFESAGKPSKGKLIAGISIGAVLVVGIIVAIVFYFISSGGDPQAQETPKNQPPPSTTTAMPEPPSAKPTPPPNPKDVLIPAPSGPPHTYNGPLQRPELEGAKKGLLRDPVRDFALANGMSGGWFNGTAGPPQTTLLAIQMPDQDAAKGVVQKYLDDQQGLSAEKDLSYQGVEVVSTGGGIFRTAYTSHNWAVIVAVKDDSEGASDTSKTLFTSLLDQQLNQTPPTVRK